MSDEYWRVWADQAARKPWDEFTEIVMPPLIAERDALQARITELEAELEQTVADALSIDGENNELAARVELLTAALTELVQLYDGTHAAFTPRSIAGGPLSTVFSNAYDNARAALAAGVTESEAP